MKVIFIQNVAKHGQIGEVKDVSDGFAINVLIPKNQAILATPAAIKKIEEERKDKKQKEEIKKSIFLKAVDDLEMELKEKSNDFLEIEIKNKDKGGNLFAQIKASDIVDAIYEKIKISLNPDQIILPKEHIKKIGKYEIIIKDKEFQKKIKLLIK